MDDSVEMSGGWLGRSVVAFQLTALLVALFFVIPRLDAAVGVLLGSLFALLALASAIATWRRATGRDDSGYLGTAEDITYDPIADPGQAARERWEKAVQRLPGRDDERD
jgi:hypothetical protein